MIKRLQPGYNGGVGALHSHSDDKPKVRYCQRCLDLFQVSARLGLRIMPLDVASGKPILKPHDYDLWLECRNCGSLYQKHETRIEAEIGYIKEAMTGPKGKVQKVEKKPKQRIRRGNNPRVKGNKWELKDSELNAELRSGSVLLSYSEVQPIQ
jgi:hypothetical protein